MQPRAGSSVFDRKNVSKVNATPLELEQDIFESIRLMPFSSPILSK